MKNKLHALLFVFVFSHFMFAQNPNVVYFQNGFLEFNENVKQVDWNNFPKESKAKEGYFGYIQFYGTPSQMIQDGLKKEGVWMEYIDKSVYLFYSPRILNKNELKNNNVRSIMPLNPQFKLSRDLADRPLGAWAVEGDRVKINLQYFPQFSYEEILKLIQSYDMNLMNENNYNNLIEVSIKIEEIETIASLPFVRWMEQVSPLSEPEDLRGLGLHRANALDSNLASGRHYIGTGVGVMVRDDGIVGPHIDFQGRLSNSFASGSGQTHGDGVAGIMAGAGNLYPYMKGMASGSDVHVVNYYNGFTDSATLNLINSGSVLVTNSSYSDGCNDGYTSSAQTVDTQIHTNTALLHVFSAGNSNNSDCGYGAGSQWGNITGGHKQSKNSIATANLYYNGTLENSSSRGPATDGRIKPDIAANGQNQESTDENNSYQVFGGTSGAAPGIAGIAASLIEAYRINHGGTTPQSALIKAVMLNTANDMGNAGPDFKYGWGHVNALRAAVCIEENRFLNSTITQGTNNTHQIVVPAGVLEARIMIYWNDPAASVGAIKALVNDLDLVVTDPSSTSKLPWKLDHTANATILNLPATNGVDHLNNMEQVQFINPAPGTYTVNVSGYNIPVGPQEYFIVYEFITDKLKLTYPIGGESLTIGSTQVLHWDANQLSGNTLIEYSTNNGTSWNSITSVASTATLYEWIVPSTVSGECLIRITNNGYSDVSDAVFSIAQSISNVQLTQVCPTQGSVTCSSIAGATEYEVYKLGTKYMELIASSPSSTVTFPITNSDESMWIAMKAKGGNNWTTQRSNAIYYAGGLLNCTLNNDLVLMEILNPLSGVFCDLNNVVSVKIGNTGVANQSNFNISYQLNAEPVVTELYAGTLQSGQTLDYYFSTVLNLIPGNTYQLKVWVTLATDENPVNNEITINFNYLNNAVPWYEDVELHQGTSYAEIQNCWTANPNLTAGYAWNVINSGGSTPSTGTGPYSAHSGNNYFYIEASGGTTGNIAELVSPELDISSLTVPELSFYYHMYGSGMGNLYVDVYNNGTWHNNLVSILGQQQQNQSDSWLKNTLLLNSFTGNVKIRFRASYGTTYMGDISIDDIRIKEAPTCPEPTAFTVNNVSYTDVNLTWAQGLSETTWQVQYGLSGFILGNGTQINASSTSLQISGLSSGTAYQVYLRAVCGANPGTDDSDWVGPLNFSTLIDYCNGSHFYDSGGATGSYMDDENIITTIAPGIGSNTVNVVFNTFQLESGYDYLNIYDGPDTSSILLGNFTGSTNPGSFTSTHPSGALTFRFTSDSSVTSSGWDASVTCLNITCPEPTNLNVSNILDNSADVVWTAGSTETHWQLQYGFYGFSLGNGIIINATNTQHTLTGLQPSTAYQVYVRANCGTAPGDDDSYWVGPVSFNIACGIITAPYSEDVELFPATTVSAIGNCWTSTPANTSSYYRWNVSNSGTTPSGYTGPLTAHSGTDFFYTEASSGSSGSEAQLVTPIINISNLTTPQLVFYYHMYGASIGSLHVDVYHNGTWINDKKVISGQQQTTQSAAWREASVLLTEYSGNIKVRFRAIRSSSYEGDISIDDIMVNEAPTCPVPTNLNVSNILDNSADVVWTAGSTETHWQLQYGFYGFSLGNGIIINATNTQHTLTGLQSSTAYQVYVRANCGTAPGDDDSYWVGPVSFNTACGIITAPYSEDVELFPATTVSAIGNCWTSTPANTSSYYRWNVSNNGTTPSDYTGPLTAHSGTDFFYTEANSGSSGSEAQLVTPIINISNLTTPQLVFYYHMYGASIGSLHVDVYHNGTWINDKKVISGQQQTTQSAAWREASVLLTEYSGNIKVRFRAIRSSSYEGDISIDDIMVNEAPTCPEPTAFTVSNVSHSNVDLTWVQGLSETAWQVEYGQTGFSLGNGIIINATNTQHTLTGLQPVTAYQAYVRANCGTAPGDDDSYWVGPVSFTTLALSNPSNLTAELNEINGQVTLNWNESSSHLFEDFNDGIANNWIPVQGNWSVNNGTYNVTTNTYNVSSSYYNQDINNFEFEAKIKKNTGMEFSFGVFFCGDPSTLDSYGTWSDTYVMLISTNGEWSLAKSINSNWTILKSWGSSSNINLGFDVWNTFKIKKGDTYIEVYINDVLQGTYYDSTFTSGKIGVMMYDSSIGTASIDYVTVNPLQDNYTFHEITQSEQLTVSNNGACINQANCIDSDASIINVPLPNDLTYVYQSASPEDLQYYKVYRDDVNIATAITSTYTDQLPIFGTYEYYVTSFFDEGESVPSNTVVVDWYGVPDIDVNPTSLFETLEIDETSTQYLTVANVGDNVLNFTVSRQFITENNTPTITVNTNSTPILLENSNSPSLITPEYLYRDVRYNVNDLNILVYEYTNDNDYFNTALTNLNMSFITTTNISTFDNYLSNGTQWDLVIVDNYMNSFADYLTNLNTYVNNGGKLIFNDWSIMNYSTNSLLNSLGISFANSFTTPNSFHAVTTSHSLFNNPNVVNTLIWSDNTANTDGQFVTTINNAQSLAIFDNYTDYSAIVLNENENTIFNAFQPSNYDYDNNSNSKVDMVELLENEISYLTNSYNWLQLGLTNGAVGSGLNTQIPVIFDATDLEVGVYHSNIIIASNDPDEPQIIVPAQLTVTDDSAGLDELKLNGVNLFPNPSFNTVFLNSTNKIEFIKIYNMEGKEIYNFENINQNQTQIDVSELSSGIYIIKLGVNNKALFSKIIKK